jgi:arylsulfatase A-like enzyme
MKHIPILTALLLVPLALHAADAPQTAKPNILVLLSDDHGYYDLGCQGCKDIPTPHIDSLAKNGVRCTSGYVTSCMCSPSRAGLLTGRSQSRFGHEINWEGHDATGQRGLPLTEKTLADHLKAAGYRTGCVGKWHLGDAAKFHPNRRGFDEFFGFTYGGHEYFCEKYVPAKDGIESYRTLLQRNGTPEPHTGYLTTVLGRESAAFIHRHKDAPWFLYAAFNAPHGPLQATQEYLNRFAGIADEKRRTYAAMVSALDDAVGDILNQLRADGLEQNTLVFFLSDNGGPLERNGSLNTPLNGEKGYMLEGGIRVPFLAQWKAALPAGKIYGRPVSSLDIAATALALAGVPAPLDRPLDGVNLAPYLTGEKTGDPHATLFWRMKARNTWAARAGDWKLAANNRWHDLPAGIPKPRLINLADDIGELRDLGAQRAEKLVELQSAYDAWSAKFPEPLWTSDSSPEAVKARQERMKRQKAKSSAKPPGQP